MTLGQVAEVRDGATPPFGAALINGQTGVILNVESQYHADVLAVTRQVEQALNDLNPTLQREGIILEPDLFSPAN